ncbi:MATE family efflux transporter [Photobacterium rosenbergii]|uniref:MATE family efflux transporter n=1 Tax=Photobacterium rosenbergii TaxID=294936 RepID=UPI001C9991CB|nr:MATE family efflux transporter [Photobacterium rosenbergii]MBY5944565.1 MATE family efflux transporter [Photobacterium rosenbergii]
MKNTYTLRTTLIKSLPIAIPVALQTLLVASRQLVDVTMLAQLSPQDVAAAGLAARIFNIATIVSIGLATAVGILGAQYFGASNKDKLRQLSGSSALLTVLISFVLTLALSFPRLIVQLGSSDPQLIAATSEYLQIVAISSLAMTTTLCVSTLLRSIHVITPILFIAAIGFATNIILNKILIFGFASFPAMGLKGAAIATTLSTFVEMLLVLAYTHKRHGWILATWSMIKSSCQLSTLAPIGKLALPIVINSVVFSAGVFGYHAMVGKISTDDLAVFSLVSTIEMTANFVIMGFAMGIAVLIGNAIGNKNAEAVRQLSRYSTYIAFGVGVMTALVVVIGLPHSQSVFTSFNAQHFERLNQILPLLVFFLILKALTITLICGVLRAAGDVNYCLKQDTWCLWGVGLPLAFFFTFVLGLGVYWVLVAMLIEEILKTLFSYLRIQRGRYLVELA